ncbi:MAG: DUF512 domain-containing protein [Chloroflexota bacterium]
MTDRGSDPAAQVALNSALARGALPITSVCNFACCFCSNRQNPAGVKTFAFPHRSLAAIERDIDQLPRSGRIVVGEAATRIDEGEPLLHPEIERILTAVRSARPQAELVLTTNGSLLDRARIERLAALAPVSVNLSLNLITPEARRQWLGDRQPERAPAAARLLSEYHIPWHGSLVGMPHITGWDEIERTLRYLADAGAQTARLFLPGFTHLAPPALRFGADLWPQLTAFGQMMSRRLALPVTVEPPRPRDLAAAIVGLIRGSPAAAAGLQAGDVITGIDGARPRCRVEAHRMLSARSGACSLMIERDGALRTHELSPEAPPAAPGTGRAAYGAHGVVLDYDIDPHQVERAVQLIERTRGETWVLTGALAAPLVEMALREWLPGAPWRVITVPNRFFGGSIMAAGLLTVADVITAGEAAMAAADAAGGARPGLIIIPGLPFDERGHDLVGRSYFDIAATLATPVELIM